MYHSLSPQFHNIPGIMTEDILVQSDNRMEEDMDQAIADTVSLCRISGDAGIAWCLHLASKTMETF